MTVFLLAFTIIGVMVAAMSVGVIFSNRRIKGSCGGVNTIPGLEGSCGCEKPCEKRLAREAKERGQNSQQNT